MKKIKAFLAKTKMRSALWLAAICLFIVWSIFGYKYQFTYNKGVSMEPTYDNGDWIIIEKRSWLPKDWAPDRFDVVIIYDEAEGEDLAKRVIGLSGDTFEIKGGVIYINEKELEEPFGEGKIGYYLVDENDKNLRYWSGPEQGEKVIQFVDQKKKKIPEGQVWVIGDNRIASWYGLLKIKNIKGLVIL
ncbi:signal peptidase I [Candidatus Pacearchaeota archaeon]|nr:signal peptidase I [Candidatus Pacearchaeota archaeon]|tara:strand:+ start:19623 stop:20186 length:564 start_codon:yes stop_codon:yes gene_type:complete